VKRSRVELVPDLQRELDDSRDEHLQATTRELVVHCCNGCGAQVVARDDEQLRRGM
jgi:hypothetical protein